MTEKNTATYILIRARNWLLPIILLAPMIATFMMYSPVSAEHVECRVTNGDGTTSWLPSTTGRVDGCGNFPGYTGEFRDGSHEDDGSPTGPQDGDDVPAPDGEEGANVGGNDQDDDGIDDDQQGSGCSFAEADANGRVCPGQGAPVDEVPNETKICEKVVGEEVTNDNCDCDQDPLTPENCEIVKYIEIAINILSGIAGIAIVGGIMIGAFMYMTARDNPGQTEAGRSRVVWALVALLILIFFWGFLQGLVPGGVLGGGGSGLNQTELDGNINP